MVNNNPLAVLWTGKCTIYEFKDVTDPDTYQTSQQEVPVVVDEPCRLSYNREIPTMQQNGVAVVAQSIQLFIRQDLAIAPGSVIEVTQNGVTEKYKCSGKSSVYSHHQQIGLKLYEENA